MKTVSSCERAVKVIAIATLVVAVTGSAALSVASANEARQSAAKHNAGRTGTTDPPSGVWRMDGYGTVISVEHDRVQEYRITKFSCLKGTSADRTGGHGGTARYETKGGTAFTLRPAGGRERASMHVDGSEGDRSLRRIEELPDACDRRTPKDPVQTFDRARSELRDDDGRDRARAEARG